MAFTRFFCPSFYYTGIHVVLERCNIYTRATSRVQELYQRHVLHVSYMLRPAHRITAEPYRHKKITYGD